MNASHLLPILAFGLLLPATAANPTTRSLPVREVTIFKDNHSLVLEQAGTAVDSTGTVVLDRLPTPVAGTFWPYTIGDGVKIGSVVASMDTVDSVRQATSMADMWTANAGHAVHITGDGGDLLTGTAHGVAGDFVVLKTQDGTTVYPASRIRILAFDGPFDASVATSSLWPRLTIHLTGPDGGPARGAATVGLMYLQSGLGWEPSYKIDLDGKGSAHLKLEGTIKNDLRDLDDVSTNLVVGVPSFAYADTIDPVALQQTMASLSYPAGGGGFLFNGALRNTQMVQYAAKDESGAPSTPQPSVGSGSHAEDLYVFPVHHVTLKYGAVMVVPVADYNVPYKDVYKLDLPYVPPLEVRQYLSGSDWQEKLKAAPEVMHTVRFSNSNPAPLTTAPALFFRDNQVISQGTMTYTAPGGSSDVDLTPALDVKASRTDQETGRRPNAVSWNDNQYTLVNLAGQVCLTNYKRQDVEVEVTRDVFGDVDSADNDGNVVSLDPFSEDAPSLNSGYDVWWYHFNGLGRIAWTVHLKPGQKIELNYKWHYYYR